MSEPLPRPTPSNLDALRALANIKLVIADLDGTVMPPGNHDARTIASLAGQLANLGIRLAIATGRSFTGARKIIGDLDLPPTSPLIAYNGGLALLHKEGRPILHKTLPVEALDEVLKFAGLVSDLRVIAYYYHAMESLQAPPSARKREAEAVLGWGDPPGGTRDFNGLPISWNLASRPDYPPTSILLENVADGAASRLKDLLKPWRIQVALVGTTYIELRPPETDKVNAARALADRLKLDAAEILVIGDNDNDVPLLTWAGTGVVVSSASDAAQAAATFVTQGGPEHGFIEALDVLKRARRYGNI